LSTLNESYITSGIEEMATLYFRFYKLDMEEVKKRGMEFVHYDDYSFPT
jgi:hypothetical protein